MKHTICLLLSISALIHGSGVCAEPIEQCPLRTTIFRIPPGIIGDPAPKAREVRRLDVREYLEAAGIKLLPGGEASFDPVRNTLFIHATDEVTEMVRAVIDPDFMKPRLIRLMLSDVEFAMPAAEPLKGLTYERARALAGESWRFLERCSLVASSGQRSRCLFPAATGQADGPRINFRQPQSSAAPATAEGRTEQLEFEPYLDQDKTTIHLELHVDQPVTGERTPKRFAIEQIALQTGVPALVRAVASPAGKGAKLTKVRALIVRATVLDEEGSSSLPRAATP